MIEFRQKVFSTGKEYDAMKSLYNELMKKDSPWRYKIKVIDSSSLLPILRGNNVVIERFVISTYPGKSDKYRLYLKIGAKAKLPDDVRLPGYNKTNRLFRSSLKFNPSRFFQKNNSETEFRQKEFGGGGRPNVESEIDVGSYAVEYETTVPRGETLLYDKKGRSLVLEFETMQDVTKALDILPFGLNYNMYLLDV